MKNTPEDQISNEQRFAAKLSKLLDASALAIPADRLEMLANARKAALRVQRTQKRPAAQVATSTKFALAGGRGGVLGDGPGFGHMSIFAGMFVLTAACLVGLFQFEQQRHIEELADLDAAVLSDDLPISAYADHGFNAFLKQNQ